MPTAKSHQPGVTFAVDLSLEILYDLLAIRFDSIITTQQTWHSCAIATLSCENASMHRDHPKLLWNISLAVHIITRLMMMAVGLFSRCYYNTGATDLFLLPQPLKVVQLTLTVGGGIPPCLYNCPPIRSHLFFFFDRWKNKKIKNRVSSRWDMKKMRCGWEYSPIMLNSRTTFRYG